MLQLILMFYSWMEIGTGYTLSAQGDPWNPRPYAACLRRDMDDKRDAIVAHRTLPCGMRVFLYAVKTGRWTYAVVGDRGPFGKRKNGKYRGIVDMSPIVNRRLRARGKAVVVLIPVPHNHRGPDEMEAKENQPR